MKTFIVTAEVTISMSTTVTANSKEEATQIARGRGMQGLCHECSGGGHSHSEEHEWRNSGEFDGEPIIVEVEESDD